MMAIADSPLDLKGVKMMTDHGNSAALRPKGFNDGFMRRQKWSFQQVDAIGNGGEDGEQAVANSAGFAGQIDDQRLPADTGNLPGENSSRHEFQ